jgi:hypothetical protein
VHRDEEEDPQRRGVAGDDVAVEGEAAALRDAAGEFQMDVGVVLPVAPCVEESVDAPGEHEREDDATRQQRTLLIGGDVCRCGLGGHRVSPVGVRRLQWKDRQRRL